MEKSIKEEDTQTRGYVSKLEVFAGGSPRPAGRRGVGEAIARFSGVRADLTFSSHGWGYCHWFNSNSRSGDIRLGALGVHVSSRDVHAGEGQRRSQPLSYSRFRKFLQRPEPPTSARPPREVRSGGKPGLKRPPRREGGGKTWRRIPHVRRDLVRRLGSRGHGSQVEMPARSGSLPLRGGQRLWEGRFSAPPALPLARRWRRRFLGSPAPDADGGAFRPSLPHGFAPRSPEPVKPGGRGAAEGRREGGGCVVQAAAAAAAGGGGPAGGQGRRRRSGRRVARSSRRGSPGAEGRGQTSAGPASTTRRPSVGGRPEMRVSSGSGRGGGRQRRPGQSRGVAVTRAAASEPGLPARPEAPRLGGMAAGLEKSWA